MGWSIWHMCLFRGLWKCLVKVAPKARLRAQIFMKFCILVTDTLKIWAWRFNMKASCKVAKSLFKRLSPIGLCMVWILHRLLNSKDLYQDPWNREGSHLKEIKAIIQTYCLATCSNTRRKHFISYMYITIC